MNKAILFSLENCIKCNQTKELIVDRDDIEVVTFPHDLNNWNDDDLNLAESYDVLDDLHKRRIKIYFQVRFLFIVSSILG